MTPLERLEMNDGLTRPAPSPAHGHNRFNVVSGRWPGGHRIRVTGAY